MKGEISMSDKEQGSLIEWLDGEIRTVEKYRKDLLNKEEDLIWN